MTQRFKTTTSFICVTATCMQPHNPRSLALFVAIQTRLLHSSAGSLKMVSIIMKILLRADVLLDTNCLKSLGISISSR